MSRDREPDEAAILHALDTGAETVRDITDRVAFSRDRVNYLLTGRNPSLADRDLVTIDRPEQERVRVDDGDQVRNRWAAKRVTITEDGVKALIEADVDPEQQQELSKEELQDKVYALEERVERLEQMVEGLQEAVAESE